MAQNYSQFATSEYLQDAPAKLNSNFSAVASQFAGTAFPNTNLVEGMVCYRTDLDKVYRYVNEEWVEEANLKDNTRCVEFIKGTQTSSTGSWKGVTKDSSLYDGKTIFYYLPKAGSGNATLNLTFPDGTTTGAKAVRTTGTTQATTQYAAGSVISLTYVQSENAWCRADYNSNTTYSALSQSDANTGTSTTSRLITAKVLSTTIANKAVAKADTITDEEIEELWAYTVTITQSENQTITVTAGGVAYTTSFTAQPGTTWTATIVADEGYNAGTLSATSGTLTDDITISATPAYERGSLPGSVKIVYGMVAGEYNVLEAFSLGEPAVLYSLTGYYNDSSFEFNDVETVTSGSLVWNEDSVIPSFITSAVYTNYGSQGSETFLMYTDFSNIEDSDTIYAAQGLAASGYISVYKVDNEQLTISPLVINATNDSNDIDRIEFAFTETGATLNSGELVFIFLSETPVTQQQVEEWFDEQ